MREEGKYAPASTVRDAEGSQLRLAGTYMQNRPKRVHDAKDKARSAAGPTCHALAC
jgi:hypothetical protein